MKKVLLFLLLISLQGTSQAQNKSIAVTHTFSGSATDTAQIGQQFRLTQQYLLSDPQTAYNHATAARLQAIKIDYRAGEARALNLTGKALLIMGNYDKGLRAHLEALKISEEIDDLHLITDSNLGLTIIYHKMDDLARAFQYCKAAAAMAKKSGYTTGLAKSYNSLGVLYQHKKEYRQALHFFRKAASLHEEVGDARALGVALLNIGDVHLFLDEPANGLPYLFEALRLTEETGDKMIRVTTLKGISKLYQALGKHHEAIKFGKQCYEMALETASDKKIAESAKFLHQLYASLQAYEEAYQYSTAYIEHNARLNLENQQRVAAEATAKYETEKKELENQKLKAEKRSQTLAIQYQKGMLVAGACILLLLLVIVLVLYVNRKRLKKTHLQLQEVNSRVQAKNVEIGHQQAEILSQAEVLKDQNRQLEEHNQFKNKIFSIISHDLRAPFLSMKGISQMAQRKTLSESQVQHIFSLINKDIDISMNMLNNLLVWSKTQMDANSLRLMPFALPELIDENLQVVAPHAAAKQLKLSRETDYDAMVLTDKERLNFILRNLLMNAIKFSYEGGEIRVKAEALEGGVTIAVSDTGKGIAAANLAKLFTDQRFTTLGTAKEKGTGLGLMLCKEMVESLNGSIAVESEEGKGTTFTVTLPKPSLSEAQAAIERSLNLN